MRFSALALLFVLASCAKGSTLVESRPLKVDFGAYRTGAVEVDPKNMEGGVKGSQELLTFVEAKLKQGGVLEPRAADQGAQLLIRIRAVANTGDDDVRLFVDFVDAKNGETVGQIAISANALGNKSSAALRRVADEIVAYMRSHRGTPVTAKAGQAGASNGPPAPTVLAPAAAATERPPAPGVITSGKCTMTCTPDSSSSLTAEDQKKVAEGLQPMLKDVRVCLDRVNAQQIHPAVIVRFESNGQMSAVKVDAGGYDDLACVQDARSRPPHLMTSRAASVRCEYRCAK